MDGASEIPEKFKALEAELLASVVATTRAANAIAAHDLGFVRAAHPDLGEQIDERVGRLLEICSSLLDVGTQGPKGASSSRTGGRADGSNSSKAAPLLKDPDDVDLKWPRIVDVVDSLLERADRALDEYKGVVKRRDGPSASDMVSRRGPRVPPYECGRGPGPGGSAPSCISRLGPRTYRGCVGIRS